MAAKKEEKAQGSQIRTLLASEIECRVGTMKQNGCSLLLYKDARVDMRMLDEVYGPNNWQRSHELINVTCSARYLSGTLIKAYG